MGMPFGVMARPCKRLGLGCTEGLDLGDPDKLDGDTRPVDNSPVLSKDVRGGNMSSLSRIPFISPSGIE